MQSLLNVYIGKLIENLPVLEFIYPSAQKGKINQFGENGLFDGQSEYVNIVNDPNDADYILVPYSYGHIAGKKEYISQIENIAKDCGKKIIVFVLGDSNEFVEIKNCIVFRMSQYKYCKMSNEIIMPAYAHDLGSIYNRQIHQKEKIPLVGFCGWADNPFGYREVKYLSKYIFWSFLGNFDARFKARAPGVLLRRRILKTIQKSELVNNDFIIRTTYSGSNKTISLNAGVAREQYVENITRSDYALAIKGDGNFSVRFYEILSMGCIPVLIDTDLKLPLEGVVDYNSFVLKVPLNKLKQIDKEIRSFHDSISDEKYKSMQKSAREAFNEYLSINSFLRHVLRKDFLEGVNV